ncbi:MAG: translation initiation factor eIF-1A [Candidatus Micrarchaeota archaeon]|nr:translation initiation factor eIF-1A [Candidatus Micrarchaeota archaeon]MDE1846526.1 translation initiation factor eIF-1A [Candidatus Micrarchaeota archaeon]
MRYQKQNITYETPMPRGEEVIGTVKRALGASKFEVLCTDQNLRVCSIPGRLRRRFWVKEGDLVLVKPWVVQSNERGDITWRYSIMDKDKLRAKGVTIP